MTYAKALALAKSARIAGLLPEIMDATGIAVSVDTVKARASTHGPITQSSSLQTMAGAVLCSAQDLSAHAAIVGSNPQSRAALAAQLTAQMLSQGQSGIVLDLSGTRNDFMKPLSKYAADQHFTYRQASDDGLGNTWINPLEGIGPDAATDLILWLYKPEDEYWRALIGRVTQAVVNLCYKAHELSPENAPYPTLYQIGLILEGGLAVDTKKLRAFITEDKDLYRVLTSHDPDIAKAAKALGAKVMALLTRHSSTAVLSPRPPAAPVDIESPGLTYISINHAHQPELSNLVTSGLLSRINAGLNDQPTQPGRFLVIIDAVFARANLITQIVKKAQAFGLCVILTTDPHHLYYPSPDTLFSSLNVTMVLRSSSGPTGPGSGTDLDASTAASLTLEPRITQDTVASLGADEVLVHVKSPTSKTDFVPFYR
jgi:hypothetical protein